VLPSARPRCGLTRRCTRRARAGFASLRPAGDPTLSSMPIRPAEFNEVALSLAPRLVGFPRCIIAIDGRDGDGKTTLGRFLAWYFNVTLLETDLYLIGDNSLRRHTEEIRHVIDARLERRLPMIVEGVGVLQLLEDVGRKPDFHIYIRNRRTHWVGSQVAAMLKTYEDKYEPWKVADKLVEVEHDG